MGCLTNGVFKVVIFFLFVCFLVFFAMCKRVVGPEKDRTDSYDCS